MDITFDQVNYIYQPNSPFQYHALKDISFYIPSGSYTAIVGHTGSGKSTLIQHLNGLLRPTSGQINIGPFVLTNEKNKDIKSLRKNVGMVFQYPEHQLFEETVKKDLLFGPKNFGINVTDDDLIEVLNMVGLDDTYLERSPFELSGGQMRRVAIASILISKPEVLILDEPTAGLDPLGKKRMMDLFYKQHQEKKQTTILITHDMEDALMYADQLIVLHKGQVAMIGKPFDILKDEKIKKLGLVVPEIIELLNELKRRFNFSYEETNFDVKHIAQQLAKHLKEGQSNG